MSDREIIIKALESALAHLTFNTSAQDNTVKAIDKIILSYVIEKNSLSKIKVLSEDVFEQILHIIYNDDDNVYKKVDEILQTYKDVCDRSFMGLFSVDLNAFELNMFKELQIAAYNARDDYRNVSNMIRKQYDYKKKSYQFMINFLNGDLTYLGIENINNNIKAADKYTYLFLKLISAENKKIYMELLDQNSKYISGTEKELELLFADPQNAIKIKLLSKEDKSKLFKYGNLLNVKEILDERRKNSFTFFNTEYPHFVDILLFSNASIFKRIGLLVKENNIDFNVFYNNPLIFISEANKLGNMVSLFETFVTNVSLLKSYGVDISSISKYDSNILVSDSYKLSNILSLLDKYEIELSKLFDIKNGKNVELLYDYNCFDFIDDMIAAGGYSIIKQSPSLIKKENMNVPKRMFLNKEINMPIWDANSRLLPEIMTGDNFLVTDDKLKDYLNNDYVFEINKSMLDVFANNDRVIIADDYKNLDIVKNLDNSKFKKSNILYDFDGILISRIGFLRNISLLINKYGISASNNLIIPALIYNSNLAMEEINNLKDMISHLSFGFKVR